MSDVCVHDDPCDSAQCDTTDTALALQNQHDIMSHMFLIIHPINFPMNISVA